MFEHLPKITEENLKVVLEKEMDYFTELLKWGTEKTETPDEAIQLMLEELNLLNPYLAKAVSATAYAVAGELDDVEDSIASRAAITTIPGVLATLRLIDRAIAAQQLEAQLLQKPTSKK